MVIQRFLIMSIIMFSFFGLTRGEDVADFEPIFSIRSIAVAFEAYAVTHEGEPPDDWNDLREFVQIDEINKGMIRTSSRSLYDLYAFVDANVPLPGASANGRIVMIRTAPFSYPRIRKTGRNIISLGSDGKAMSGFIDEDKIGAAFAAAKITLPSLEAVSSALTSTSQQSSIVQNTHAAPTASPQGESTPTIAAKPSSGLLILAAIVLAGVLVGAFVLFRKRK